MTTRIPNVFHFVFGLREQTEPFHLMHYLCLKSCLEVAQPDAICFHYQHEPIGPLWLKIKPFLTLRRIEPETPVQEYAYADQAIAAFRYAHISDFVRLQILVREGGVYADMDTLFVHKMPLALLDHECFMGHEKPPAVAGADGSLCNALIGAASGSRFCQLWLDAMEGAFDGTWSNHSTLLPYRLAKAHTDLIHVEPESSFFSLDWSEEGLADIFLRRTRLHANQYSLHLWSHLWFASERRDFSAFSGELLTEEYLAFGKTTYADYARAFAPSAVRPSYLRYLVQKVRLLRDRGCRSADKLARRAYRQLFPRRGEA